MDEEDKLTERIVRSGQHREVVLINESGLYALQSPYPPTLRQWLHRKKVMYDEASGAYIKTKKGS